HLAVCTNTSFHRPLKVDAAFLTTMITSFFANLGQRDRAEQLPESFAIRQFVFACLRATEESATGGLANAFRPNATTRPGFEILFVQPLQHWTVLLAEDTCCLGISLDQSVNQPVVGIMHRMSSTVSGLFRPSVDLDTGNRSYDLKGIERRGYYDC